MAHNPPSMPEDRQLIKVEEELPFTLLILPLENVVLYPGMLAPIPLNSRELEETVAQAESHGSYIGCLTLKNPEAEKPQADDFYSVGVAGKLLRTLKMPNGNQSAIVQIQKRMRIEAFIKLKPFPYAKVAYLDEIREESDEIRALAGQLRLSLTRFTELIPNVPQEFAEAANTIENPARLADFAAANFPMDVPRKQEILETVAIRPRLEMVLTEVTRQLELAELGQRLQDEIRSKIEASQKEFFLREQLKLIRRELGEEMDEKTLRLGEYEKRIGEAGMPEETEKRAREELNRLSMLQPEAAEYNIITTYLDWLTKLPWSRVTEDHLDIERARKILDHDHYGLEEPKARIVEFLAVRKLKPDQRGPILCFAGPPGVGKTSLGRSIANALGRKFFRFSLGGMRDEAEIKGHRRTYIGAMPGKILQGIAQCDSANPVFMLDEVDKLASDWRGDPSSALLEVLDPEQNHQFLDHYLDAPFDLSRVMFIATANILPHIPSALRDRMEVIELSGYIDVEKVKIASRYLLPKQREAHGLEPRQLQVSQKTLRQVVIQYTREAGVRNLEREIARICRKVATRVASGEEAPGSISEEALVSMLGPRRFTQETLERVRRPGVVVGLAWTAFGGEILYIESARMKGRGLLKLTGKLGEVMTESANIALSFLRARADDLGLEAELFKELDVHVHFPAGAVPKDGPSAGITIASSLFSLLTQKQIRARLAMTGEISLVGNVLPVGGIREKVVAAKRAGIKQIILPALNEVDLMEIPDRVKGGIKFHFVDHYDQVLPLAFPGFKSGSR